MKNVLRILSFVLICAFCAAPVFAAENFPQKPIIMVVPKSAGGAHDMLARGLARIAPDYFGQNIVVDLKPGGGGAVGGTFASRAAPDGYTILFGDSGVNSDKPAEDPRLRLGPDDMEAVCILNMSLSPIMVRADSPFKTFQEFIEHAKKNPDTLRYASAGAGGWNELAWRMLIEKAGIKMRVVPYEGGAEALLAVLGGHVDITSCGIMAAASHLRAGTVRPLLILQEARADSLPDVPTAKELGIDLAVPFWKGMTAPKGTPRPIIDKLAATFEKMMEDPSIVSLMVSAGDQPYFVGPEKFAPLWRAEYENQKLFYSKK